MGLAYLPDGRRMDYEKYLQSKEWKSKKESRLIFDNWQCGICHKDLGKGYETHHINYSRLGHEDVEKDLISICHECHKLFHELWKKQEYWTTSPLIHWKEYSLTHTARLCNKYLKNDFMYGGEHNLCSRNVIPDFIDLYFKECEIEKPAIISVDDVIMFFRNKRYELLFNAESKNIKLEAMLDEMFGPKGKVGKPNPKRAEAKRFFSKHKLPAMKRIYKENENILILMKEVNKLKEDKTNAET